MNLEENIVLDTDSIELSLKEFLKQEGIIKLLTKKGDTLVNKSISSRMLNHWEELNLIDNNRENGKGWRKFSILDSVWMEIILELRNFGFPNDKILNVKNHFLNTEGKHKIKSVNQNPFLQFYVANAIAQRKQIYISVFSDGQIEFITASELSKNIKFDTIKNFISINLNELLERIYEQKFNVNSRIKLLTEREAELLMMIRTQKFDYIKIGTKGGKPIIYEGTNILKKAPRIVDLLAKGKYQDITTKQKDGKIVSTIINQYFKK